VKELVLEVYASAAGLILFLLLSQLAFETRVPSAPQASFNFHRPVSFHRRCKDYARSPRDRRFPERKTASD